MELLMIIFLLVVIVICMLPGIAIGIVFGKATNAILESRGYRDDWFWLGFFFTWIPLVIALFKPDISEQQYESNYGTEKPAGYWTCSCGRHNPPYTGTCACGNNRY